MSLNGILNTAVSGLLTNQTALRTTSNNIANVNTEGYQRREVQFGPRLTGATLTGVKIEEIRRIADQYLSQESLSATGLASKADTLTSFFSRVQQLVASLNGDSSLQARVQTLPRIIIVAWVAQTFLQLVLLPVIIVGQNVQARAADKRSQQTYADAEAIGIAALDHDLVGRNAEPLLDQLGEAGGMALPGRERADHHLDRTVAAHRRTVVLSLRWTARRSVLLTDEPADPLQPLDVVADRFEDHQHRDGEQHARNTPRPAPERNRHKNRHVIQ